MAIALLLLLAPWMIGGAHVAYKHHRSRRDVVQAYPSSREAEARAVKIGPFPERPR